MHQDCTAPEQWRPVVGYEGLYDVSDHGRIRRRNKDRRVRPFKILKPYPQWHGYMLIQLYRDNIQHGCTVHGLIAAAFIGPRPEDADVNHIDADKTNNRASNLEYVTRRENLQHADALGLTRRGVNNGRARFTEDQVRAIRTSTARTVDLMREYSASSGAITGIRSGKTWKHLA